MGWKYELSGDATLVEVPIPGTSELVRIEKGSPVELDVFLTELPAAVKVTEVKPKKAEASNTAEEGS